MRFTAEMSIPFATFDSPPLSPRQPAPQHLGWSKGTFFSHASFVIALSLYCILRAFAFVFIVFFGESFVHMVAWSKS